MTGIVQQIVDKGHVSFKVDNTSMKGDPDYGATKYFGVVYKLPTGETWARACRESDTVNLVNSEADALEEREAELVE